MMPQRAPRPETPMSLIPFETRHVFVGVGERKPDGNYVRYYRLT